MMFSCPGSALILNLDMDELFLVKPLETEREQTLLLGSRAYRYSLPDTLHRYAASRLLTQMMRHSFPSSLVMAIWIYKETGRSRLHGSSCGRIRNLQLGHAYSGENTIIVFNGEKRWRLD